MSFNKEKEFQKAIGGAMDEVKRIALAKGFPFIASFAVADDGEQTKYVNYLVSAADVDKPLTDDHLIEHANVINGFKTTTNKLNTIDDSFMEAFMAGDEPDDDEF